VYSSKLVILLSSISWKHFWIAFWTCSKTLLNFSKFGSK
jgi:hypothetical protein